MSVQAPTVAEAPPRRRTKGERTAQRIMDEAERLFAERGFEGTTLRDVATAAEIREPGIYNHFAGKEALYCAVLERGLGPMMALLERIASRKQKIKHNELPVLITDLLAQHPYVPALFHQTLLSQDQGTAGTLMNEWLDRLFTSGQHLIGYRAEDQANRRQTAIQMITMFNLCTGYFLSRRIMAQMGAGDLLAPENLTVQKQLLQQVADLFVIDRAKPALPENKK